MDLGRIQYEINCLLRRVQLTMIPAYDVIQGAIIFARDAENAVGRLLYPP